MNLEEYEWKSDGADSNHDLLGSLDWKCESDCDEETLHETDNSTLSTTPWQDDADAQQNSPKLKMYSLVDCDPSGIEIHLTYTHGSKSLAYTPNMKSPLKWLGILPSCMNYFPMLLPLSDRDYRKLYLMANRVTGDIKREVLKMMHNRFKVEIDDAWLLDGLYELLRSIESERCN